MKIFVVNLKKNTERLKLIARRLASLGIQFERFEAVYGRDVSSDEKRRNSSRFWWWAIKGYPMRDGEYGCAMSHLLIYRRILEDGLPYACVLEDDANPREALPSVLSYVAQRIEKDKSQVYLISNHREDASRGSCFHVSRVLQGACTDGYIITAKAAQKILEKNLPIKCPSDTWGLWVAKKWIELYQVYPEGVNQEWTKEGYVSDVTAEGDVVTRFSEMSHIKKVIWKLSRLIGKFMTYLLR